MNRQTPLAVVALAALAFVAWVLRSESIHRPGLKLGGNASVIALPVADDARNGTARRDDPGANGYGSISGQVVLLGEIPVLPALVRAGDNRMKLEDQATCAREDIPDESLLVDEQTRGIANVFVYLMQAERGIHPRLQQSAERRVVGDVKDCRYQPHASIARTDQVIVVHFFDGIPHNLHERSVHNARFSEAIKPLDRSRELEFAHARPELRPFPVVCDIHPWIRAYWLILDHPYAAITDSRGRFTITDLPAGNYAFCVWHERFDDIDRALKVAVRADETTHLDPIRVPVDRLPARVGR